jgi:predicted DNA-binding ribbon-helix-helix protein
MKSPVVKRSIIIDGHKTSVSLEDAFWSDLREIAHSQQATPSKLVTQIDQTRQQGNLSSAIRLYVLEHIRRRDPKEHCWIKSSSDMAAGDLLKVPATTPPDKLLFRMDTTEHQGGRICWRPAKGKQRLPTVVPKAGKTFSGRAFSGRVQACYLLRVLNVRRAAWQLVAVLLLPLPDTR